MKSQRKLAQYRGRRVRVLSQACQVEPLETRRLLATVTGTVFNDLNGNGTQDAGELGVANWTVFIDKNNNFVRETGTGETSGTTDANGNFTIGGVTAGTTIKLAQIVKVGYLENTPSPHTALTVVVPASSSAVTGQNFAIQQAVVGGRVYQDYNQNGVRESNEPGLGGVTVSVGTFSTLTSGSGIWGFAANDIANGTYSASQATISNYAFTSPVGGARVITVNNASAVTNYDFGNVPLKTISGIVVNDQNDNVAKDGGEPGLAGWTVFVDYDGDTVVDAGEQSAVTAGDGTYTLTGIRPGSYFVRAVPQTNWKLRPASVVASPTAAANATGIDFVPSAKARITGYLWYDVDADGVKDATEPPQVGWGVFLDANSNGVFDTGETRTVSDSTGKYLFTNLTTNGGTPVQYKVRSQIPANWSDQPTNRSSNLYTPNVTGGAVLTNKDFGYVPAASVSGTVFADADADGTLDTGEVVLADVRVFADANSNGTYDAGERSTLSLADGTYKLWSLPAGTYRIDFTPPGATTSSTGTPNFYSVPLTAGQNVTGRNFGVTGSITGAVAGQVFNDLDGDGTKDAGEAGIPSVRVFIDANNNGVFNAGEVNVQTSANGLYTIGSLAAGTQHVAIVLPANYQVTGSTQVSNNVTIVSNAIATQDFSIKQQAASPGTIAGNVFNDVNSNGTKDGGETNISNVRLFVDANTNGTFDAGELTSLTDGNGNYSIANVTAGSRTLVIVLPANHQVTGSTQVSQAVTVTSGATLTRNFSITPIVAGTGEIAGFVFDDADSSGDFNAGDTVLSGRQIFIDTNNNGTYQAGTDIGATTDGTGTYHLTSLSAGTFKVYLVLNAGESRTGTYPAFYTVTLTAGQVASGSDWGISTPGSGSIAGFVYLDTDQSGDFAAGDTVLPGRQMFIDLNNNGTYQAGTDTGATTDGTGTFVFGGLPTGTYKVYLVLNAGETPTGTTPAFYTVNLAPNQNASGSNFSIFDPGSSASIAGFAYFDENLNGTFEGGDGLVTGRQVFIDANNNGVFDSGTDTETTTDGTGTYTFSGLAAGTYKVYLTLTGTETQTGSTPVFYTVNLLPNQAQSGFNFSIVDQAGSIAGFFYDDNDASDSFTAGDGVLVGWRAFIDTNNNATYDAGTDVEAISDGTGTYHFTGLAPATYKVYQQLQSGGTPNAATPAFYTVNLAAGEDRSGIDFGDLVP